MTLAPERTVDVPAPRVSPRRLLPPRFRHPGSMGHARLITVVLLGFDLFAVLPMWAVLPRLRFTLAVMIAAELVAIAHAGLYRPRLTLSVLDDSPLLVRAALTGVGLGVMQVVLVDGHAMLAEFVRIAALLTVALIASRTVSYAMIRQLRVTAVMASPTIVVGAHEPGPQLATALQDHREYGLDPIGFVVDDAVSSGNGLDSGGEQTVSGLPALGDLFALSRVIRDNRAATVIIGTTVASEADVVSAIRLCDRSHVEIYALPRLHQVQSSGGLVESVCGVPLVRLRRPAYRALTWRCKRILDVVLTAVTLAALSPVFALVALAVLVEGGRPVLFRQERVGRDGLSIWLLKFRSMRPATEKESATRWSIADDARVSRLGRFLRRSSLDELPQLWNILRGDMTLVGPRPERPHFVERFSLEHEEYAWRHRVPCGLTGWAQVNGLRGDTSISERSRLDNYYIENWSLWLDVKILLRTVGQVIRATGE